MRTDTYFYPSIAGTLLIHELGGLKDLTWMNYLKVRVNYAQVGAATDAYRTISTYDQEYQLGEPCRCSQWQTSCRIPI